MSNSGSLTLYKNFKQFFEIEHYLNVLFSKFRSVISRLRLSAHQLRTETGRYACNRTDRALRLCTLCAKSDLETSIVLFWFVPFMIQ